MNKTVGLVLRNETKDPLNLSPAHEKVPQTLRVFCGTTVAGLAPQEVKA
jgi:hypothetical protein